MPLPRIMYSNGFTDLVSVIPPGAQFFPTSKIQQSALGKVPGRRQPNGLWAGYDWRRHRPTAEDVQKWTIDGANVGLRADHFPAVDIDCTDERLAQIVEDCAIAKLGAAPVRVGRAPKRLLVYRTDEPFGRMRLWIKQPNGVSHLVEVLGMGQQFVVHGTHPGTMQPYTWLTDIEQFPASAMTEITRGMADAFMTELAQILDMLSMGTVEREGDGRPLTRMAAADQAGLLAPSLELLKEAMALIPNTTDLFPTRTDYIRMGYAIKAAAGHAHEEEGYGLFSDWAMKWEGNNLPEVVQSDWLSFNGPKVVGWSWIAQTARPFGFNDAALDFDAVAVVPSVSTPAPAQLSDRDLANRFISRFAEEVRSVPAGGAWFVWKGSRWVEDDDEGVARRVGLTLDEQADQLLRRTGSDPRALKKLEDTAKTLGSAYTMRAVKAVAATDERVVTKPTNFDAHIWLLNTVDGVWDIRTGTTAPHDPRLLLTKSTSVPVGNSKDCTRWKQFLLEATSGNVDLCDYLQRLAGYCLSGSVQEHAVVFLHGPGGNGKSVFLNTLSYVLGDYAKQAPSSTFLMQKGDRASNDVAMLQGARFVAASETGHNGQWDEARLKALTGGDPITARRLYQEFVTFQPQFKLVLAGNEKPALTSVDEAMRRRLHLVEFTANPKVKNPLLQEKLRDEGPGILAWMIEGAVLWSERGLDAPACVISATNNYFTDQDVLSQWIDEMCVTEVGKRAERQELFSAWQEWSNARGEDPGSMHRFADVLRVRGFNNWKHPESRRAGHQGIALRPEVAAARSQFV